MFISIFSIVIALFFYFYPSHEETFQNTHLIAGFFAFVGGLVIVTLGLALTFIWSAIQRAEYKIAPRVFEILRKDMSLKASIVWLFGFSLISYAFSLDLLVFHLFQSKLILVIWIVLFGVSLDVFIHLIYGLSHFLSPFQIAEKLTQAANKSIREDEEGDLCDWIDALCELLLRSVERSSLALCISVNNEIERIAKNFFIASKSISHPDVDDQSKALGISDKVSYTLFFILQRLEMIYEKVIEKRFEPVCTNLITVLGKIAISAADCDWSLVSAPLHFLGKWTHLALNAKISEVGPKAIYVLLGVSKSILEEENVTYSALKEPFQSIIQHMESITKEMFRQDKKLNIAILTQPFRDLKAMFKNEKAAANPDTPGILAHLDRIIGEFDALELVMKTLPPLPVSLEVPKDILEKDESFE